MNTKTTNNKINKNKQIAITILKKNILKITINNKMIIITKMITINKIFINKQ